MATRSRTSFQKRQKEIARAEKQRDKAAKRLQKKLGGGDKDESDGLENGFEIGENGELIPLERPLGVAGDEQQAHSNGETPREGVAPGVGGRE